MKLPNEIDDLGDMTKRPAHWVAMAFILVLVGCQPTHSNTAASQAAIPIGWQKIEVMSPRQQTKERTQQQLLLKAALLTLDHGKSHFILRDAKGRRIDYQTVTFGSFQPATHILQGSSYRFEALIRTVDSLHDGAATGETTHSAQSVIDRLRFLLPKGDDK